MRLVLLASALLLVTGTGGPAFVVTTVAVTDVPQRLDAADLDGDGDLDLAVLADRAGPSCSLQVLLNGGGSFVAGWSAVETAASTGLPWDIDLADTDGDADADVLYVVPTDTPRQRFNAGAGTFDALGSVPAAAVRTEQQPADMNEDGDVDLVYYDEDIVGYLGTLKGSGDGTFQYVLASEAFLVDVDLARRYALGDVTGDGLRDVAMASKTGLRLFRAKPGTTLPGFQQPQLIYATGCLDLVLVDVNGDARLDVVATVPSLNAVVVLVGLPAGSFGGPQLFPAGLSPDAIAAADFDLDGAVDLIVANPTTGAVTVLRGSGSGSFGAPVRTVVGRRPTDIVAADLDGDGDIDVAVTCAAAGHVAVMLNQEL